MEQRFTQISTFMIVTVLLTIAFLYIMIYLFDYAELASTIIIISSVSLIVLMALFYKMTIIIDNYKLTFYLGIGLIRKSFNLSEIQSYRCVKISPLDVGIKTLRNGWRYTVGGSQALELYFKNSSNVVQIGTKYCNEICNILNLIK